MKKNKTKTIIIAVLLITTIAISQAVLNRKNENPNKEQMKNTDMISVQINENKPTLLDFYADWCAPCRIQSPIIDEIEVLFGSQINVIKVDVDKNPELAKKYGVVSIPAIMIFKDGEKVWKEMGIQPKDKLENIILELL